jgi:hypothetical protein
MVSGDKLSLYHTLAQRSESGSCTLDKYLTRTGTTYVPHDVRTQYQEFSAHSVTAYVGRSPDLR